MQFVFLRWQLNTIAQQTENGQAYGKITLFRQFALTSWQTTYRDSRDQKQFYYWFLSQRCACKTVLDFKE